MQLARCKVFEKISVPESKVLNRRKGNGFILWEMFQVLGFQKDWHEENQGSGLKLIFRWKWRFRCLQRLIRTQLAQLRFLSLLVIASNFASSSSFGRPVVSVECPHIQLVRIVWSIKILPGYAFAPWPHPWEEEGGDEERKGAQMETLQECETALKSQC